MSTTTEAIPQTTAVPATPDAPPPPASSPPTPADKAKATVKFEQKREARGWRRRDGGGKWAK